MAQLPAPTLEVVTRMLSEKIRPRFSKTPHSRLNPASGRKLPRPAGGPSASQDFYEDQEWKTHLGTANLLLWCVRHLGVSQRHTVVSTVILADLSI